jgi:hypothetical protein
MKHLLITASLLVAMASPALANKTAVSEARINDHYKTVIEQTPYKVELCKNTTRNKAAQAQRNIDSKGMTINIPGAAMSGGKKEGQTTYTEQRQCEIQTRYREVEKRIYSHSTVTFMFEGQRYELKFSK